ncbi:hypothetical protein [Weissella confusa]|uniref:hypothetical protein n=1 Tax=Weissella confusa TaxID=1583 RepID=UPI00397F3612
MDYEEIELELFPGEEEQTELDIFGDALATHTGVWARKVTETGLGEHDIVLISVGVEVFDSDLVIDEHDNIFVVERSWRCCQDYGQVFSTPQGAATPKNFQNPDFSLKWRDFWVFL